MAVPQIGGKAMFEPSLPSEVGNARRTVALLSGLERPARFVERLEQRCYVLAGRRPRGSSFYQLLESVRRAKQQLDYFGIDRPLLAAKYVQQALRTVR